MTDRPSIFLCTPEHVGHGECMNCGGSSTIGGTQEALHTDHGIFCSTDCHDEAAEYQARAKAPSRVTACNGCGLDNFEHADTCTGSDYERP